MSSSNESSPKAPILVTQPSLPPMEEFLPYLEGIWQRRHLSNNGPLHQQLEAALIDYLGVQNITLFSNGTLALVAAIKALGLKGEIITTPFSFVATANAILLSNCRPVFVDIEPGGFNLDPKKIEAAITPNTTAILPVHCYGYPCDVEEIQRIADKHGLKVIYDAAHAFGVNCHCGSVLNHGDMSVLSFHATKVFSTLEGGAVISHTKDLKQELELQKNFGFVSETDVVRVGSNAKLNEISAAFGLSHLRHQKAFLERRASVAKIYNSCLSEFDGVVTPNGRDFLHSGSANWGYYPILLSEPLPPRDVVHERLRADGIFSRRYFYPLITDMSAYTSFRELGDLSNAREAASRVLCLPIHANMTEAEAHFVCEMLMKGCVQA